MVRVECEEEEAVLLQDRYYISSNRLVRVA